MTDAVIAGPGRARLLRGRSILDPVLDILAVIGAAIRVSAALESRRGPSASDLKILGIDRDAFRRIRTF